MRVRLVKRVSRKGGKEYVGYSINLPKGLVESLNFSEVEYVSVEVRVVDGKPAIVISK